MKCELCEICFYRDLLIGDVWNQYKPKCSERTDECPGFKPWKLKKVDE